MEKYNIELTEEELKIISSALETEKGAFVRQLKIKSLEKDRFQIEECIKEADDLLFKIEPFVKDQP